MRGRRRMSRAFSASDGFGGHEPRALPWAGMNQAFGLGVAHPIPPATIGSRSQESVYGLIHRKLPMALRSQLATNSILHPGPAHSRKSPPTTTATAPSSARLIPSWCLGGCCRLGLAVENVSRLRKPGEPTQTIGLVADGRFPATPHEGFVQNVCRLRVPPNPRSAAA